MGDALSLRALVDGKTRQPQHWKRVGRKTPAFGLGQGSCRQLRGGYRRETDDFSMVVDRHTGRADVVAELVLSGIARKEAVEVDIPGPKIRPVVFRLKAP